MNKKQLTEVLFVSDNKKCLSLKTLRYLIETENKEIAFDVAKELLKNDTIHHNRYNPIFLFKTVYGVG